MHGASHIPAMAGDPATSDPRARRIAELSAEYLEVGPDRRMAIADEIAGLIAGKVTPLQR